MTIKFPPEMRMKAHKALDVLLDQLIVRAELAAPTAALQIEVKHHTQEDDADVVQVFHFSAELLESLQGRWNIEDVAPPATTTYRTDL
jgi:hypothetical protein